ncbi:hypothetical protein [Lysobacter solisilvae (ex Woo and Kim 2020)]|uniref:Uncharacterized protein n=1 Tax=Agrilutibacter terrestris TaxID=2865112 RepID=A0A7H0FVG8_9GAMM|nr:hypothetical protein [Lysobacter terrestris]QNP40034.1 hypothetical protein H8B22_11060 [Lysobacter terrestris]
MTYIGAKGRKKSGSSLFALLVLAIAAAVACWALLALFPVELHQVGQWLQAKFDALRK